MSTVVTTLIALLSGFAGLATLVVYLYGVRRSDLAAAREEALALAETRRQVIEELEGKLAALGERQRQTNAEWERQVRELRSELDETRTQARNEAYQTQHFYAAALSDLLTDLRTHLERTPPDVEAALEHLRRLAGERPAA
jgi:biopolymer transport protein ExbB/TolQ